MDDSLAAMPKVYPAREPKIPPGHPGGVAADILDEQRVSIRAAAAAMGLSHNMLAKIARGEAPVTAATALRFGVYFGNGPELWLNLQQAYDLWHAKRELADELKRIEPLPRD
jgi:addiction module HigA family antidote